MPDPAALAAARLEAIAELEAQLSTQVDAAQRSLYEGLLARLADVHADPGLLPALLADYQRTVLVPLATYYAEQLLKLPGLSLDYFQQLGQPDYARLRAPLADFLTARLGIDASGRAGSGGYLAAVQGDTTVSRTVLAWAYQQQASGTGLNEYRQQLQQLVTGSDAAATGVVQELYRSAYDDFNRNDRALQVLAAKELGLQAFLYQGGTIDGTRPFCRVRNGKCFTDFEVRRFGTKSDAYGGYSDKAIGKFAGKTDPYDPMTDCGGYNCRHGLHAIPNVVALQMRPDLAENEKGELYLAA